MKNTSSKPPSGWLSALRTAVAVVAITGVSMGSAMAVTLAGTTIGNQAAATYTDASLTPRTATSNTVTTIVAQVAAFTLTANQSQIAAPGAPVNFPHTITNTGNGSDSFSLAAVVPAAGAAGAVGTGIFSTVGFNYYADANCNGVADNAVTITTVSNVAAGASSCFVAVANVPVGSTSGQTGTLPILATSAFATATTATNTDTVTVSSQAIINVTKSISLASGPAGTTPVTYTLTYTNTGNSAATQVILSDFLPAGVVYIAGATKLNGVLMTESLTALATPVATAAMDFGVTVAGRVTAIIPSIAAGQSGTLTFNATMGSAVAPVTAPGVINNQARYCYNDGLVVQPVTTCTPANATTSAIAGSGSPTNTATFTILPTAGVAANSVAGNSTIGGGGAANVTDTSTVASVSQGATVVFTDYIHNNGNGTDTFNLALTNTSFPAGTTFLLFKTDGVTPLVDTNTIPDGIVDTGPVAAGAAYAVVVKAVLPSGVSGVGVNYTNVLTATSSLNPAGAIGVGFDTVNNVLTTVTPNSVDLTNGLNVSAAAVNPTNTAKGLGANTGTATPILVNPGAAATYPLFVNNTSAVADSYVVTASAMPVGWTVSYFFDASATQGLCTTLGGPVTNTGVVNGVAGAVVSDKVVCAVVTSPASALPGNNPITFTATSPTTGVSDTKAEIVTVNTVRSITLTPPNAGQVFPSGSVVYTHTLTNTGNVAEVAIGLTDPMSGVSAGWANVVYLDNAGAGVVGVLDPADTVVSATTLASLAPGASVRLFAKVLSPASAAAGDINTSSLTATITGVINTVAAPAAVVAVDNTTVIVGQVLLVKTQMLDLLCAGNLAAAFSNAPIPQAAGAIPGACIVYQITATNVGTAPVNNVIVSDATPANTAYACKGPLAARVAATGNALVALTGGGAAVATAPATCSAGTISSGTIPSLAPGASAVLTFGVQINP